MTRHVIDRPLGGYDDVMAVRSFLSNTYRRTRTGRNWEIRRWEGQFWHDDVDELEHTPSAQFARIHLWESRTGHILGVATPEDGGDAHLQVDPRERGLEPAMLDWAEQHLAESDGDRHMLTTFCLADDEGRAHLLRRRGYSLQPSGSVQRWRDLTAPVPRIDVDSNVEIRGLRHGDRADIKRLTGLINAAFGHGLKTRALVNFFSSPSYDPDLQIVAERDGELVSHAGIAIDSAAKLAIVEPVCTHPRAAGQGLATAVVAAGLRRAVGLGATRAVVGTGLTNPSNHVYAKLGFDHIEVVQIWQRAVSQAVAAS